MLIDTKIINIEVTILIIDINIIYIDIIKGGIIIGTKDSNILLIDKRV